MLQRAPECPDPSLGLEFPMPSRSCGLERKKHLPCRETFKPSPEKTCLGLMTKT